MAEFQHQGLSALPPTPPTNLLPKGAWKLTPELMAEIQPYLSFDLAKVVLQPGGDKSVNGGKFIIPGVAPDQRSAAVNQDVTGEYTGILNQLRGRNNPGIYGTAGAVSGASASQAFHQVYGGKDQASGGTSIWRPTNASTYDTAGVAYDAAGQPIARPQDQWNIPDWQLTGRAPGWVPTKAPKPTFAAAAAQQFQVEHPGYFQVGEDEHQKGSYDRGAISDNEVPTSFFPNGVRDPNSMVKFDPKYGYIAPLALQKRSKPDFLAKYGQYIPIAFFAGGVAATAATGGFSAASTAPAVAGGAPAVAGGAPAVAGGAPAVAGGAPAVAGTGGIGESGFLGGIFNTGAPAAGGGFDWLSAAGTVGSALMGGGGAGSGGGYGGLLSSLVGSGLSIYQARQVADSMQVQDKSTDYSKTSGGHTSFDPSIRGLQDASLGKTAALESGVMGYGTTFRARSDENKSQYDDLYRELTSNQNPFIQARVNPLKEQIAGSRGQIQRNQGLRGVSGSSFGNDELTNFDFGAQRQLGDAGALATHDALGARGNTLGSLSSLNQNQLSGETQLTNSLNTLNTNRTGIAKDRASLERAGLGLSADSEAATRAADIETQNRYGQILQRLLGGSQ